MREILFRGKRVDNGEWIEGMLCNVFEDEEIALGLGIQVSDAFEMVAYHVISEAVGQYTGLLDMNGKKIFEGDVVACGDGKVPTEIRWVQESSAFMAYNIHRKEFHLLNKYFERFIGEVIGNIHENPELLKGVTEG